MEENRTTEDCVAGSALPNANATALEEACGENHCLNKGFPSKRAVETGEVSVGNSETQSGSICGKFKDVQSLRESYEKLESAFTQKCQQVAQLKKDLLQHLSQGDTQTKAEHNPAENNQYAFGQETSLLGQENAQLHKAHAAPLETENAEMQTATTANANIKQAENENAQAMQNGFDVEHIHELVHAYVLENPEFACMEETFLKTALTNTNIVHNEHFLEQVSAVALGEMMMHSPDALPKQIIKKLAGNKALQQDVISNYIAELNTPALPTLMTSKQGAFSAKCVQKMPNSIKEAGKLAQSLFQELF